MGESVPDSIGVFLPYLLAYAGVFYLGILAGHAFEWAREKYLSRRVEK